jgi:hypothetical protein
MLMRRRLYFILPDIESARSMLDEMLLARIEIQHVHFLARRDTLPPDLPEAPKQMCCKRPMWSMAHSWA